MRILHERAPSSSRLVAREGSCFHDRLNPGLVLAKRNDLVPLARCAPLCIHDIADSMRWKRARLVCEDYSPWTLQLPACRLLGSCTANACMPRAVALMERRASFGSSARRHAVFASTPHCGAMNLGKLIRCNVPRLHCPSVILCDST